MLDKFGALWFTYDIWEIIMASFLTNKSMFLLNEQRRAKLRDNASLMSTQFDKIQYICNCFLKDYRFDYSVLISKTETEDRPQEYVTFEWQGGSFMNATVAMVSPDEKHGISLSPSVHALKMGTCAIFSAELEWFAKEFGIKCERIQKVMFCYDDYKKVKSENKIRQMIHHYVVMDLDGSKYKIDVAGALMAMDYNKNNTVKINPADFMFVEPDKVNPFLTISKLKAGEMGDI